MTKKQHYLIVDVETSITDKVVDFAAVVCDRKGNISHQCAILVREVFNVDPLFYDKSVGGEESIWSRASVKTRMENYNKMLDSGSRIIASVNAINNWLAKVSGKYSPTLTAYNISFDTGKCKNTGIDISESNFPNRFCLWHSAAFTLCKSREYRKFILNNHLFNKPTAKGNMTYRTDAEAVTGFLNGKMENEPHTALEDIIGFEIPVLREVLKLRKWRNAAETKYNWVNFQVKNHFKV